VPTQGDHGSDFAGYHWVTRPQNPNSNQAQADGNDGRLWGGFDPQLPVNAAEVMLLSVLILMTCSQRSQPICLGQLRTVLFCGLENWSLLAKCWTLSLSFCR